MVSYSKRHEKFKIWDVKIDHWISNERSLSTFTRIFFGVAPWYKPETSVIKGVKDRGKLGEIRGYRCTKVKELCALEHLNK